MPRRSKPYPPEMRGQVIGMLRMRTPQKVVKRVTGVSMPTISRWWMQYLRDGVVPKARKSPGHPTIVTLANLLTMKRALDRDPFLSAKALRSRYLSLQHLSLTTMKKAIRTTLQLKARRPAKKPILTERMINDRLQFCHQYQDWTEEHWDQVLFTDEVILFFKRWKWDFH